MFTPKTTMLCILKLHGTRARSEMFCTFCQFYVNCVFEMSGDLLCSDNERKLWLCGCCH